MDDKTKQALSVPMITEGDMGKRNYEGVSKEGSKENW